VFAYSLVRAVEQRKQELSQKFRNEDQLTQQEQIQLYFFRQRGAIYLLVAAVSGCLETILGQPIANLFLLSFGPHISPLKAMVLWQNVVIATIPLCQQLAIAFDGGLKVETISGAIQNFQSLVAATVQSNAEQYKEFAKKVVGVHIYPKAKQTKQKAKTHTGKGSSAGK
jgi:hypothetical protein